MLEKIIEKTNQYIEAMPKKERKKYGQFFTSMETAQFMASMFVIPEKQEIISVLDAGAGSGILSCAMIEMLEKIDEIKEIEKFFIHLINVFAEIPCHCDFFNSICLPQKNRKLHFGDRVRMTVCARHHRCGLYRTYCDRFCIFHPPFSLWGA